MDLWAAQTQARGFILLLFAVKVAFLLSLSKQEKRAARVQWPSFLQAGMPLSGCHIGHSTATSELRGPFAGVGGQMESGCACTAILHWHTASALISPRPLSIHLFIQPSLSLCSHALSVLPNISQSNVFLFVVFFVSDTLSIKTFIMLTLPQWHTPVCLSWRTVMSKQWFQPFGLRQKGSNLQLWPRNQGCQVLVEF